jgi:hypothetical protein
MSAMRRACVMPLPAGAPAPRRPTTALVRIRTPARSVIAVRVGHAREAGKKPAPIRTSATSAASAIRMMAPARIRPGPTRPPVPTTTPAPRVISARRAHAVDSPSSVRPRRCASPAPVPFHARPRASSVARSASTRRVIATIAAPAATSVRQVAPVTRESAPVLVLPRSTAGEHAGTAAKVAASA